MSVVSVSVRGSAGRIMNEACKYGVQADVVDVERDGKITTVFVDLHGAAGEKVDLVITRSGASRLAEVDKIEHGETVRPYPNRQTKDEEAALRAGKPYVW